jgi:hypothetical protein
MTKTRRTGKESAMATRVKTTVELDADVWEAAKMRAVQERTDLRKVLTAALRAYLKVPAPARERGR